MEFIECLFVILDMLFLRFLNLLLLFGVILFGDLLDFVDEVWKGFEVLLGWIFLDRDVIVVGFVIVIFGCVFDEGRGFCCFFGL